LSGRHFFRKRPPDVGEGHSRKKCLFLLYHITVDTGMWQKKSKMRFT
jgi:hypothetical protein